MKTFVVLIALTRQGMQAIKESPARAEAFSKQLEKSGCSVKGLYWTFGSYNGVIVIDAPDDNTAHAVILRLAHAGNLTTQTMQAFDAEAMKPLVAFTAPAILMKGLSRDWARGQIEVKLSQVEDLWSNLKPQKKPSFATTPNC